MTEAEWLASQNPRSMIRHLIGPDALRVQVADEESNCRASERKLRLFTCACYYRICHLLPDPVARATVQTVEGFADGLVSLADFSAAQRRAFVRCRELEGRWRASRGARRDELRPTHEALGLAAVVIWGSAPSTAYYGSSTALHVLASLTNPGGGKGNVASKRRSVTERVGQCRILRDIFGNPFRPVTVDPAWRTTTAVQLAQGMYDSRDFSAMPILADALQDAGCDNADILDHCRGAGPHVRGCWVVDLVLGKE
jgi:hypothetical protein